MNVAEALSGTTLTKAFVHLPGGGTAIYNSSGLAYYRHADWLGSSRLTSTATRPTSAYSSSAYAPFGEQYATSGTADASFTGQNSDSVSSLYDFTFRENSQSQGRWLSPDPSGMMAVNPSNPQSWNRYAYVANNPMRSTDPTGMEMIAVGCDSDAYNCDRGGGGGGGGGLDANGIAWNFGPGYVMQALSGPNGILSAQALYVGMVNATIESLNGTGNNGTNPCGMCIYMNDAGTAPDPQGIDPHSNADQCKNNGGVFVDESGGARGDITVYYDPNSNAVMVISGDQWGGDYVTVGTPGQYDSTDTWMLSQDGLAAGKQASWQVGYSASSSFWQCVGDNIDFPLGSRAAVNTLNCFTTIPGLVAIDP